MKRSIISLLIVGLCTGTATIALAQNVTAGDQPPAASPGMAPEQAETTNPSKGDSQGMAPSKDDSDIAKNSNHAKGDDAFKKADKDNDGTLDRKEAKAMPHVAKNFKAIDTDNDGTVSMEGVHIYMAAHPGKKGNT